MYDYPRNVCVCGLTYLLSFCEVGPPSPQVFGLFGNCRRSSIVLHPGLSLAGNLILGDTAICKTFEPQGNDVKNTKTTRNYSQVAKSPGKEGPPKRNGARPVSSRLLRMVARRQSRRAGEAR